MESDAQALTMNQFEAAVAAYVNFMWGLPLVILLVGVYGAYNPRCSDRHEFDTHFRDPP